MWRFAGYGTCSADAGRARMPDEPPTTSANRDLAVKIVSAYLRRNQVAGDQIGTLISIVHQGLADLGKPATEAIVERTPAVSIRRSVHRDYVVCLECGWRGKMVRRQVAAACRPRRASTRLPLACKTRQSCLPAQRGLLPPLS